MTRQARLELLAISIFVALVLTACSQIEEGIANHLGGDTVNPATKATQLTGPDPTVTDGRVVVSTAGIRYEPSGLIGTDLKTGKPVWQRQLNFQPRRSWIDGTAIALVGDVDTVEFDVTTGDLAAFADRSTPPTDPTRASLLEIDNRGVFRSTDLTGHGIDWILVPDPQRTLDEIIPGPGFVAITSRIDTSQFTDSRATTVESRRIRVFDSADGTELWGSDLAGNGIQTITIGRLLLIHELESNQLVVHDAITGDTRWSTHFTIEPSRIAGVALNSNRMYIVEGRLIVGSSDRNNNGGTVDLSEGRVTALNSETGNIEWKIEFNQGITTVPVLTDAGLIIVSSDPIIACQ